MKTMTRFVVILARDNDGPLYLGRLDTGRQGVRVLANAIRYKSRTQARLVARDYGRDVNADILEVESGQ